MSSESDAHLAAARTRLEAAERLYDSGYYEDSISRSYYCAFNAARALLASEGMFTKTHRGTVSKFGEVLVKGRGLSKYLGKDLHTLQAMRENAEYIVTSGATPEEAEWALKAAARILEVAHEILRE
jgi:uncharacterized protein (UPF0332 family)